VIDSLETYADESGIHARRYCVVCGLVGSSTQWRTAENRWSRTCDGIVFHAKQFFGRDDAGYRLGPYKGWSHEKASKFLAALFDAISERELTLVGAVVDVQAFNGLSLGERRYLTLARFDRDMSVWRTTGAPSKPWFLGFGATVALSAAAARRPDLKVDFWFDRQNEYEGLANDLFQQALGQLRRPT
jgi:hypothetical protein